MQKYVNRYEKLLLCRLSVKELQVFGAKLRANNSAKHLVQAFLARYEIDNKTLQKIEESRASDTEKVFNLLRSIQNTVSNNAAEQLYLPLYPVWV